MTGISTYGANTIFTTLLGTNTYIGFATAPITPEMDGTNIPEPNPIQWDNYSRVLIDPSWWSTAVEENIGQLSITCLAILVFPTITNTSQGCEITGWAILDSITAGNVLFFGDVDTELVGSGITPKFESQTLTISINLATTIIADPT